MKKNQRKKISSPPVLFKPMAESLINSSGSKKKYLFSFLVFAFAFSLYANTLNHGYVLDDDVVYLKNKDVQAGLGGIKSILNHSFIYGFTGHNDQSYRPVVLIIYAIEKECFGNNPHMGHLINVLLFALSCVLLFRLMKKLKPLPASPSAKESLREKGRDWDVQTPSIRDGWLGIQWRHYKWSGHLPLITVLLFVSHPIHTETVANIKGRDDILNFIFLELALLFILKFVDVKTKTQISSAPLYKGKKYLWLSTAFFFLSLMCKEMAVTFLAIIPLTVFFFREIPMKKTATLFIPFVVAFGIYMFIRNSVLETVTFAEKMKVVNNALAAATNESDRIASALFILGKYVLLLFFPHPLSWDYSYNQIPVVSFSAPKVLLTLLVFAVIGVYAIVQVKKKNIFAYCILFFFITMSVVSNIFIMIGSTLGERFLFIPSLAFCIALPFFIRQFGKNILIGIVGGLVVLFSFKTFSRNRDWKDNFSLFLSGVEATPNSSRAESALGSAYREMAEKEQENNKRIRLFEKALVYYKKSIEILPENTEALYNAGVSYYGTGDKENALKMYEATLKVSPEYGNAANNAGVIYFERQEYEKAKEYFLQALKYLPNNADALGNLGAIEHNTGNIKKAIEYYNKSLQLNPANQNVRNNLEKAEKVIGN